MNNLTRFIVAFGLIVTACKGGNDEDKAPSAISSAKSSPGATSIETRASEPQKSATPLARTPPPVNLAPPAEHPTGAAEKTVGRPIATKTVMAKAERIEIRNALLFGNVLLGGHPTPDQVRAASKAGYKTIINLQLESEPGVAEERALARELGITYVSIPVAGAAGMTESNARALDAALAASKKKGPTMFHCASGNRVGGLYALRAYYVGKSRPADALTYGKKRGLRSLEPKVRSVLGL